MDHAFYLISRALLSFESYYRSGGWDGHWGTSALSCSASSSGKTSNGLTNKARTERAVLQRWECLLYQEWGNYFLSQNKPHLYQGPTTHLHPKLLDPYTFLSASLNLGAHILWGWDSNLCCKSPSHMRRVQVLFLVVLALQLLEMLEMPPHCLSHIKGGWVPQRPNLVLEAYRFLLSQWSSVHVGRQKKLGSDMSEGSHQQQQQLLP